MYLKNKQVSKMTYSIEKFKNLLSMESCGLSLKIKYCIRECDILQQIENEYIKITEIFNGEKRQISNKDINKMLVLCDNVINIAKSFNSTKLNDSENSQALCWFSWFSCYASNIKTAVTTDFNKYRWENI